MTFYILAIAFLLFAACVAGHERDPRMPTARQRRAWAHQRLIVLTPNRRRK
jgi:hypothetical protein